MTDIQCPAGTDVHKATFQSDSSLMSFLKTSTLSLPTTEGQDNDTHQRNNICNPDRTVDIVTLYLAKALGLSTANIINNFVYDVNQTYVFPLNNTHGPTSLDLHTQYYTVIENYFPNLKQTYWTILSHYTTRQTFPLLQLFYKSVLMRAAASSCLCPERSCLWLGLSQD